MRICTAEVVNSSLNREAYMWKAKVEIVFSLLAKECPSYASYAKDAIVEGKKSIVGIQKKLYHQAMAKLFECRDALKLAAVIKRLNTTASTPTSSTTVTAMPKECYTAINLTELWRQDHKGANIKPGGLHSFKGYACDLNADNSRWFRFSAAAGRRMSNTCPKAKSCGTFHPLWTDEPGPSVVGVEATVNVYLVNMIGQCKAFSRRVKVMRCSWDMSHDLIYKQTTNLNTSCYEAFCGMM